MDANAGYVVRSLRENAVIPVAVIDQPGDALPLVDALISGGLTALELALRTSAALDAIRLIATERPGFLVGAGTVLDDGDLEACMEAGAKFALSPGINPSVVESAQLAGLPFFPGVMTPTDAQTALALDCQVVKLFPAEAMDGLKMIHALDSCFGHLNLEFIPLGGLDPTKATFYLREPSVLAVGGSWVAPRKTIAQGDWAAIERNARDASALRGLRV